MIEDLMRDLDAVLRGPVRVKQRLLAEARAGLEDAVEAYTDAGLDVAGATRRAVAEFGGATEVAPVFQAELDVMRLRHTAMVTVLSLPVIGCLANLAWDFNPHGGDTVKPAMLVLGVPLAAVSTFAGIAALAVLLLTYRPSADRELVRSVRVLRISGLGGATLLALALLTLMITAPLFLLWPPFLVISMVALTTAIVAVAAGLPLVRTSGALS